METFDNSSLTNRPKGKGRRAKPKHEFKTPETFPSVLGSHQIFEREQAEKHVDSYEGFWDADFRSEI